MFSPLSLRGDSLCFQLFAGELAEFLLEYFQGSPGALLGGFYPDKGANSLGYSSLFADYPSLIVIGNLQFDEDAFIFCALFSSHYIIRRIYD